MSTTVNAKRLVLWDIDQTLVDVSGIGASWYGEAFTAVTGTAMRTMPHFAGRTERAITTSVLTAHGVEADETTIQQLWSELTERSARSEPTLPNHGNALPGAAAALDAVADRGAVQSLVTGNLPEIAKHKLAAFGLDDHIEFDIGGYGSISLRRDELVKHAINAASDKHQTIFDSVIVIGDTPQDIEAANQHDALAIGVATGRYDEGELIEAGAHATLANLADTHAVQEVLFGG